MLKTETKTIDGVEFTTIQFPAMRSFELLAKLVKQIGPALALMSSVDPDTQITDLAPHLMSALSGLEPAAARALVVDVLSNTQALLRDANGQASLVELNRTETIDRVFSGKLRTMFVVLGHALKVNYGDFTEGSAPNAPQTPSTPGQ